MRESRDRLFQRPVGGYLFRWPVIAGLLTLAMVGLCDARYLYTKLLQAANTDVFTHVILGPGGCVYGVSVEGGTGLGSVFKISDTETNANWFCFVGTNGSYPLSPLTVGRDGNLYGTTAGGGLYSRGTVFRLSTNGILSTLASFGPSDGLSPQTELAEGNDGCFYGTTFCNDEITNSLGEVSFTGFGTIYRLDTNGTLTTIFSFSGTNGSNPAGVIQSDDGMLYGTTHAGGDYDLGTAFKLTTNGVHTLLVSFNGNNGSWPSPSPLTRGLDGCFYGATTYGGRFLDIQLGSAVPAGCGTLFRISTNGSFAALFSFNWTNGMAPAPSSLVSDGAGGFYGATVYGGQASKPAGSSGTGTVFHFTSNGGLNTLLPLDPQSGAFPFGMGAWNFCGLVGNSNGIFYGMGAYGAVFQLNVGTSPTLRIVQSQPGSLIHQWAVTPGQTYQPQSCTSLQQGNWANLGTAIDATNASLWLTNSVGAESQRFFRLQVAP